jgi:ribonuclease HI
VTDRDILYTLELALAQRRPDAIPGGYEAIIDDAFLEVGSSGRIWTRADILEMLVAAPPTERISIERFEVAELGGGVVLVLYDTAAQDPATGQMLRRHRSSIWIRDGDRYRLRFHQGTPAP